MQQRYIIYLYIILYENIAKAVNIFKLRELVLTFCKSLYMHH